VRLAAFAIRMLPRHVEPSRAAGAKLGCRSISIGAVNRRAPPCRGPAGAPRLPPPWSVEETDACFIDWPSSATRTARSISLSLKLRPSRTSATTRRRNVPPVGGLSDDAKLIVR
jgi:hypothetical protein